MVLAAASALRIKHMENNVPNEKWSLDEIADFVTTTLRRSAADAWKVVGGHLVVVLPAGRPHAGEVRGVTENRTSARSLLGSNHANHRSNPTPPVPPHRHSKHRGRGDNGPRASTAKPISQVQQVAKLLAGKTVVLVGGDRRPYAEAALVNAFGLKRLDWVETHPGKSIHDFLPRLRRPTVSLVLLAIRWSSHAYKDVKSFCERDKKPLVFLPAGYGPQQVARRILSQCDRRLEGSLGRRA